MQMPVKVWLSRLPAGYKELALEALDPENESVLVSSTSEAIEAMCAWRDTKQGVDFWHAMSEWGDLVGELPLLPSPVSLEQEPGSEPAKPRKHWVGQKGTAPGGAVVKIMEINGRGHLRADAIWLFPESKLWYNMALYQSITWEASHEV